VHLLSDSLRIWVVVKLHQLEVGVGAVYCASKEPPTKSLTTSASPFVLLQIWEYTEGIRSGKSGNLSVYWVEFNPVEKTRLRLVIVQCLRVETASLVSQSRATKCK